MEDHSGEDRNQLRYMLLTRYKRGDLSAAVSERLDAGWKLHGPPGITPGSGADPLIYSQAVIRERYSQWDPESDLFKQWQMRIKLLESSIDKDEFREVILLLRSLTPDEYLVLLDRGGVAPW